MVTLEAPTSSWRCSWWQWRLWWQCRSDPEAASLCMARVYRVRCSISQLSWCPVLWGVHSWSEEFDHQVLSKPALPTPTRCAPYKILQVLFLSEPAHKQQSFPAWQQLCSSQEPNPLLPFLLQPWTQECLLAERSNQLATVSAGAGRRRYQSSTTEALSLYRK